MTNKRTAKTTHDARDSELEALRERLARLEVKNSGETDSGAIGMDEYISVMSLLPYPLNLSTKEGGQGNTKKFSKFGEVKRIIYRDLVDILEVHPNFVEAGYFYILHPAFIRQHGLDDVYSKILTKEKIEEILSVNSEEYINLYNSANPKQQEVIVELLVGKLTDNPNSVDLNAVDKISRLAKVDIVKKAEEQRELLKDPSE